jgi:hypothetical protein
MIGLVLGGARCVWSDLAAAREIIGGTPHFIIAANHVGIIYTGSLDAWATLHHELIDGWREERAAAGLNTDFRTFIHARKRGVDAEIVPQGWYGSSGLYAAQVALEIMGAAGVMLCGVPMDADAGHINGAETWPYVDRYRAGFEAAKADGANIRSMSGWSAELFGRPDGEWLADLGIPLNLSDLARLFEPKEPDMRVKMLRTRNYTPPSDRRQTTKFLAGQEYTVKREWGDEMVRDGDADEVKAPRKPVIAAEDEA